MSKINQTYRYDQPECSIWVGVSQEQKPSYGTGRYWYKLQYSTVFIRQFEKPSWLKRICMEFFFGVEFIDILKTKESNEADKK